MAFYGKRRAAKRQQSLQSGHRTSMMGASPRGSFTEVKGSQNHEVALVSSNIETLPSSYTPGMRLSEFPSPQSLLMDFEWEGDGEVSGDEYADSVSNTYSDIVSPAGSTIASTTFHSDAFSSPPSSTINLCPIERSNINLLVPQVTPTGPSSRFFNRSKDLSALLQQQQATLETILSNQKSMEEKQVKMESKLIDLEKRIATPQSTSLSSNSCKSNQSTNGKRKQIICRDLSVSLYFGIVITVIIYCIIEQSVKNSY